MSKNKKNKAAARSARAADAPQTDSLIERLISESRLAILPDWLQEGRVVWFWRETYCFDGDLCVDSITPVCPFNGSGRADRDRILRCSRRHPILTKTDVWSVTASFEPLGIFWTINDCYTVRNDVLLGAFFPTQAAAMDHRPEVILYG